MKKRVLNAALIAVWIGAVAGGMHWLLSYKAKPGDVVNAPEAWPTDSKLPPLNGKPRLLVFAHPMCPCTQATIGELDNLLTRTQHAAETYVLFQQASEPNPEWENSKSWRAAKSIPGVSVSVDLDGKEASRFGALTSGHVVLYDGGGKLLFGGGITGARGHMGDNLGKSAVIAHLQGGGDQLNRSSTFGCELLK